MRGAVKVYVPLMRSPINWVVLGLIVLLAGGVIVFKANASSDESVGTCVPLSYADGSWLCSYEGEDPRVEYRK